MSFSLTKSLRHRKSQATTGDAPGIAVRRRRSPFCYFRPIVPIGLFVVATFYMLVLDDSDWPMLLELGIAIFAAYLGIKAPELFPEEHDQQAPNVNAQVLSRRHGPF